MQTGRGQDLAPAIPFLVRAFVLGVVLWVAASAALAIPHGPGHSIGSMTPIVVFRDVAFPVWVGSFVSILAGLALRAWRSLDTR